MAIVATLINTPTTSTYTRTYSVTAQDADTGLVVTHGLPFTPQCLGVVPLSTGMYLGTYMVTGITPTQFTITKGTAMGSGGATPGVTPVCQIIVGSLSYPAT